MVIAMRRKRKTEVIKRVVDDDLRHRRKMIVLANGPLSGEYYVDNISSYICLPNVSREILFAHDELGYKATEWLYYKNDGSGSKHKHKGYTFTLESVEHDPVNPTVANPWNCVISAARASWVRGESRLYRDAY